MQFKDLYKLYRFAPPIAVDPPLPIDDLSRECSLNDDAYYDAEHYFFVGKENDSTSSLAVVPPLNAFKIQMIL